MSQSLSNIIAGLQPTTLLKKKTLGQVFSFEFCEIFISTYFIEYVRATVTENLISVVKCHKFCLNMLNLFAFMNLSYKTQLHVISLLGSSVVMENKSGNDDCFNSSIEKITLVCRSSHWRCSAFLEFSKNSQRNICDRVSGLQLYYKRDSGTGVSYEFCKIFKNTFFTEHLRTIASGMISCTY